MVCELGFEVSVGVHQKDSTCGKEEGRWKESSWCGRCSRGSTLRLQEAWHAGLHMALGGTELEFRGAGGAHDVEGAQRLRAEVGLGCRSRR